MHYTVGRHDNVYIKTITSGGVKYVHFYMHNAVIERPMHDAYLSCYFLVSDVFDHRHPKKLLWVAHVTSLHIIFFGMPVLWLREVKAKKFYARNFESQIVLIILHRIHSTVSCSLVPQWFAEFDIKLPRFVQNPTNFCSSVNVVCV